MDNDGVEVAMGILVIAVLVIAAVVLIRDDRAGALDDPRRGADGGGFGL